MSARVCNPMAMSEIAKLRSPAVGRKPLSNSISLARVKRDLFGPVDKQESKNFIDRELAAHNEALSKKWGFDFCAGQPLQNHEQYQWERVPPTSAPDCFTGMVTLTRVAHVVPPISTASEDLLDQRAERENANIYHRSIIGSPASVSGSDSDSDCSFHTVRTYPLVLRSETSAITARVAVTTTTSNSNSSFPASANRAKRQQRITDYLKERKRLSSSPKVTITKKARHMLMFSTSSSPSSSSSSSMSSSTATAMQSSQQDHQ